MNRMTDMTMNRDDDAALLRLVRFYETLTPQSLARLDHIYAFDARFKDPFNDVRGLAAIRRVFEHMFAQLLEPRFIVTTRMAQGADAFLAWEMQFRFRRWAGTPQVIRGATHVRFDADGLVLLHRDYWDAAEELYEKLPLLGRFMRVLKRAVNR
ncbi:nuclear transport factor 2 family protein [Rugamonas sp.]|uniref:nuclear transport factor 2 family protein n=1 Tax=Rugamonas sp. TaxID=1926287 RepID=UPI0025CCBD85|nr:nuclear transport factor 2 family protein [Rugamonas sp.]